MAGILKKIKNDKKNKNQQPQQQQQPPQNNNNNSINNNVRENHVNHMQAVNHLTASQTLVRKSSSVASPAPTSTSFSYPSSPINNHHSAAPNLQKSISYSNSNSNTQPDVVSPKKRNSCHHTSTTTTTQNNINNNSSSNNNSNNNSPNFNNNKFRSSYELLSPSSRLPSSASMYFPKPQVSPPRSPPLSPTHQPSPNQTPPTATLTSKRSLMFLDFGGGKKKQMQIDQQTQQLRENCEEMERMRHELQILNQVTNNYLKDKFKSEEEIQSLQQKNKDLSKTNEYLLNLLSEYKNDINRLRNIIEHPTSVLHLSDSTTSIPSPQSQTPPTSPEEPSTLSQQALVEDAIASINDAMTFIFSKPPTGNSPYRRYLREKKKSFIIEQKILQQQLQLQQNGNGSDVTTVNSESRLNSIADDVDYCDNSLLDRCESSAMNLLPTPLITSPEISDTTDTTTSTTSSPLEISPIIQSCTFLQQHNKSRLQKSSSITSPETLSISISSSQSDANSSIDITPPSTASNTAAANTPITQSQLCLAIQNANPLSMSSPVSTPPSHTPSSMSSSYGSISTPTTSASQALKRFNEERPHSPLNRTKSLHGGIMSSQQSNSRGRLANITNSHNNSSQNNGSICYNNESTASPSISSSSGSNSSPSSPAEGSPRTHRINSSCKYNTISSNKQIFNNNKPRISLTSSYNIKSPAMFSPIQPISTSSRPVLKSPPLPNSPQFDSATVVGTPTQHSNNNNHTIKKLIHFFEPKTSFKL